MSRPCSICNHEKRAEIDALLISSEMSFEMIAARFEGLTAASLHRHKTNHLFKAVRESKRAQDVVKADSILDRVEALIGRTEKILETCEKSGDTRTSIAAIREIRGNLELLARLDGELKDQINVQVVIEQKTQFILIIKEAIRSVLPPEYQRQFTDYLKRRSESEL